MPELEEQGGDLAEMAGRLRDERDAAVAERDGLLREVLALRREKWVTQLAHEVGFQDSSDAWLYMKHAELSEHDWDSRPAVVRALRDTLREKPYLAQGGTSKSRSGSQSLTFNDVRRMSSDEINRRWDEVQCALAGQG